VLGECKPFRLASPCSGNEGLVQVAHHPLSVYSELPGFPSVKNRLSASTARLIESLHAKKRLWDKFAHPNHQLEIIHKIADADEPAAIPDLLPILVTGNRSSGLACAQAIQRLLMQLKPADFARFDEYVRQGYSNWDVPREPWYCVKPVDVAHLASLGTATASVLGIASCHMNGYVREAAMRELGKIETGAGFATSCPASSLRHSSFLREMTNGCL
jgi:hypothetical protein